MKIINIIILFTIFITVSCSHRQKTVKNPLDELHKAVYDNNPHKAYSLLSERAKQETPYAVFKYNWKTYRKEILSQLKEQKNITMKKYARIKLENGSIAEMIFEDGKWKVLNAPGLTPRPSTPEELINLMIYAIERMDLNLYMSLLSPAMRKNFMKTLEDELNNYKKIITVIKKKQNNTNKNTDKTNIDNQPPQNEVIYNLPYNKRRKLKLKKYNGVWKIESIEKI